MQQYSADCGYPWPLWGLLTFPSVHSHFITQPQTNLCQPPHHPSTQTIFIGQNWKKHCWQIKYLPEHSGLLHAAYTLELWPVQHKSIFKWLRGHIRWALVMNETLVITSAILTQNSWRPSPVSCIQQSATSLVQMSGKPLCQLCRNDDSRELG